jgi:hypothetical protein
VPTVQISLPHENLPGPGSGVAYGESVGVEAAEDEGGAMGADDVSVGTAAVAMGAEAGGIVIAAGCRDACSRGAVPQASGSTIARATAHR